MLDFGEELSIESYRIPWLIWIQLIVLFLLLALFFLLSFDDSSTASASSASASASASAATNPRLQKSLLNGRNNHHHHVSTSTALTNRLQHTRAFNVPTPPLSVTKSCCQVFHFLISLHSLHRHLLGKPTKATIGPNNPTCMMLGEKLEL